MANGTVFCSKCNGATEFRKGVSKKTGKPWQGFKCLSCDNMDFIKDTPQFHKEVREVKEPFDKNHKMMILSYAKDLVIAQLEKGQEFTEEPIDKVIKYYEYLKINV